MANKNGWGAAKPGKAKAEESYTPYKEPNVKSSKDLKGLYGQYQGKTLGSKGK